MKITNNGKYAKRINQLIKSFKLYFNITDDNIIIESINSSINLINYFNPKKIYFYKHSYDKIECDIHKCNFGCGIIFNVYKENKTIIFDDYCTLQFPTIEEVINYEYSKTNNKDLFKNKYSDYLK